MNSAISVTRAQGLRRRHRLQQLRLDDRLRPEREGHSHRAGQRDQLLRHGRLLRGGRSETNLGRALGAERQNVVIATKFGVPMGEGPLMGGASRRYVMQACEASLKRLGTDYIDVYIMHVPDADTPTRRLWTRSTS